MLKMPLIFGKSHIPLTKYKHQNAFQKKKKQKENKNTEMIQVLLPTHSCDGVWAGEPKWFSFCWNEHMRNVDLVYLILTTRRASFFSYSHSAHEETGACQGWVTL